MLGTSSSEPIASPGATGVTSSSGTNNNSADSLQAQAAAAQNFADKPAAAEQPSAPAKPSAAAVVSAAAEQPSAPEKHVCAFCDEGEDSDDADDDPIIDTKHTVANKKIFAHEACLDWTGDIWQDEDYAWVNVAKSYSRCRRIKCAKCGEPGASLGCKRAACSKSWHVPCAFEPTEKLGECAWIPTCHPWPRARAPEPVGGSASPCPMQ